MKITKIQIKSLFGIKQCELDGASIELKGKNGVGKTSVIDSIRYALTNKSGREYIVRNGETEGEILIETDNGLKIDRKARTNQADYKSIKQNGREVGSPESFLKDIFTPLQLNPVEFMDMDSKNQNSIILDMIQYDWGLDKIREWFGEIPDWVSYDQNILCVLNDIQSEKGMYYQNRRDVDRDIRNKKAFIEDIAKDIPEGYDVEHWETANVGDLYREIERIQKDNATIERARNIVENHDNKVRKFQADLEIEKAAIERETANRYANITDEITRLRGQIEKLMQEQEHLVTDKVRKFEVAEQTYKANVAKFDAEIEEYKEFASKETVDTTELNKEAAYMEAMKKHINEYKRMIDLQKDIESLNDLSNEYNRKIEKARELPGEILETATIPISGLTVANGIPLINGLPISNLSEGEKLDLCIDVTLQKPNGLQIVLIDGAEKLSTELREKLYQKCKNKGIQFIATRTTDDDVLEITEF